MTADLLTRLKYGSGPWNVWRREHPDAAVNLDGANLHEADLRAANLTGAQYSADDLEGALHVPQAVRPSVP